MASGPRLRGKHGRAGVAPALAALAAALAPLAVLLLLASFAAAAGPPAGDAATDEALARKEAEVTRLLRDAAAHPVLVRPAAAAAGPAGTGAGNTAHHARKPTYQGAAERCHCNPCNHRESQACTCAGMLRPYSKNPTRPSTPPETTAHMKIS